MFALWKLSRRLSNYRCYNVTHRCH